jgi:hypothetical protein
VRENPARKAIAIRVHSPEGVAFKFKVKISEINVADPDLGTRVQDYFITPNQEWVFGVRVAEGVVRQFQVVDSRSKTSVEVSYYPPSR